MEFKKRNVKIYILAGKARAGKNIVAKLINENISNSIVISYASYLKEYVKNISNWDGSEETKPRELLQNIGIELIKNKIDDKFLINRIIQDIEVYSYFYDVIIISDARLKEEINFIKNKFDYVKIIHVYGRSNDLTESEKNHVTETDLDDYNNYDYEINNRDYEETKNIVKKMLEEI